MAGDFSIVNFSPGEALLSDDLNLMQQNALQEAWEWPGYADILGFVHATSSSLYGASFQTPTEAPSIAYTKGAGMRLNYVGLGIGVNSGFIGTYPAAVAPIVGVPKMRWVYNINGFTTFTLTAAPPGQTKWVALQVKIDDALGTSTSRHFKDGVTGALSSSSLNKQRNYVATYLAKDGTPSAGTPSMPALDSGYALLGLALVDSTGITRLCDTTLPIGSIAQFGAPPSHQAIGTTGFTVSGGMLTLSSGGASALFCPPGIAGDPTARVVAIQLTAKLTAASLVRLRKYAWGDGAPTTLDDVSSQVTMSGSLANSTIKLMTPYLGNLFGPYWMNGERVKDFNKTVLGGGFSHSSLCLEISPAATGDEIRGVNWIVARG